MTSGELIGPEMGGPKMRIRISARIGIEVEVHVEVNRGRMSLEVGQDGRGTRGRRIQRRGAHTRGRRIQRGAQERSSGNGREARQAVAKLVVRQPAAPLLEQLKEDLPAVMRGLVMRGGPHVKRELRCTGFGKS